MELCCVVYPKIYITTIAPTIDVTVNSNANAKSVTCCFVHPLKNVILISLSISVPSLLDSVLYSYHLVLLLR